MTAKEKLNELVERFEDYTDIFYFIETCINNDEFDEDEIEFWLQVRYEYFNN